MPPRSRRRDDFPPMVGLGKAPAGVRRNGSKACVVPTPRRNGGARRVPADQRGAWLAAPPLLSREMRQRRAESGWRAKSKDALIALSNRVDGRGKMRRSRSCRGARVIEAGILDVRGKVERASARVTAEAAAPAPGLLGRIGRAGAILGADRADFTVIGSRD